MSIENILQRIEEETRGRVAEIMESAGAQAALIREDHAKRGAKLQEELGHAARARAADEERRLVVGEELDLRKAFLGRKREILGEIYGEARKRIEGIEPREYLALVASLIVKNAHTGNEEIVVPAGQKALFSAEYVESLNRAKGNGAAFSLAETPGDFRWGVVLREGRRRVDLTLDVLFEQLKARVESEIAGVLFPG